MSQKDVIVELGIYNFYVYKNSLIKKFNGNIL